MASSTNRLELNGGELINHAIAHNYQANISTTAYDIEAGIQAHRIMCAAERAVSAQSFAELYGMIALTKIENEPQATDKHRHFASLAAHYGLRALEPINVDAICGEVQQ